MAEIEIPETFGRHQRFNGVNGDRRANNLRLAKKELIVQILNATKLVGLEC